VIVAVLLAGTAALVGCSDDSVADPPPSTESTSTESAAAPSSSAQPSASSIDAAPPGLSPGPPAGDPCVAGEPAPEGPITIMSGGLERTYRLTVPDPPPSEPAPVILNLHGAGSNAAEQDLYSELAVRGPARGFIVVSPDGTGQPRQWNIVVTTQADDVAFIDDLLVDVAKRACIDRSRTYSTGMSSGAAMSSLLACEENGPVGTIAPVAGVVYLPFLCDAGPPRSVIAFHGTDDRVLPYGGGPIPGASVLYPGVAPAMAGWAHRAQCAPEPERTQASPHVTLERWTGCVDGTTVELYIIDGGGHTWPGAVAVPFLGETTDEISATDILLDAFSGE
jgi:polyhydroxybutyrate depolymerase